MKFTTFILIIAGILAALALLPGCAGSAADTNFRRRVKSGAVTNHISYDAATNQVDDSFSVSWEYRDPKEVIK